MAVPAKGAARGAGAPDVVETQRLAPAPIVQKKGQPAYPQVIQQQPPRIATVTAQTAVASAPPGSWYGGGAAPTPLLSIPQSTAPRRFPGHFMPHRLCNHFSAQGWCRKAETCTFAHGWQELHPDVQAQMAKSMGLTQAVAGNNKGKGKGGKSGVGTNEVLAAKANIDAAYLRSCADATNFNFNVGATPFLPTTDGSDVAAPGVAEDEEEEEESAPRSDDSPSGSQSRRPVPAPLQLDDSPNGHSAAVPAVAQPSPLGGTTRVVVRQPLPSPLYVPTTTMLRTPLASPHSAAMISPSAVKSLPRTVLMPSTTFPAAMQSPVRVTSVRPSSGLWPGSPTMPLSPTTLAAPRNPIPRNMLLQARTFVQKLEQGPPGLAHCAPTPTTKAYRTGFRYPQPGWLMTTSQSPQVQTVPEQRVADA
mmetsp:Transcript_84848/g.245316  ORF Transcript_84848/g.245316 Transcript_84848/m.245316 type:complete len:419 (+) Transcript_84848:95-1351(+)